MRRCQLKQPPQIVQRATVDTDYLRHWAEALDLTPELDDALRIADDDR